MLTLSGLSRSLLQDDRDTSYARGMKEETNAIDEDILQRKGKQINNKKLIFLGGGISKNSIGEQAIRRGKSS